MISSQKRVLSIFDILGPIMIGPSSNHTAGAVRIGKIARMILDEEPNFVKLYFYGSLAETYKGHMTNAGVIAGLLGLEIDNPKIKDSLLIAKKRQIKIEICTQSISNKNPNTIELELKSKSYSIKINAVSIGGGEIIVSKIDEFNINITGNRDLILIIIGKEEIKIIEKIQKMLGKNLIFTETIPGDSRYLTLFYIEHTITQSKLESIMNIKEIDFIRFIRSLYSYKLKDENPLFTTINEVLLIAKNNNKSFPQVIIDYEVKRSGLNEKVIRKGIEQI